MVIMIVVITINPLLYKHNNREGCGEFGGRIAGGVARPHCNEGCAQVPPSIIIMFIMFIMIINIMVVVNVVDTCLYFYDHGGKDYESERIWIFSQVSCVQC